MEASSRGMSTPVHTIQLDCRKQWGLQKQSGCCDLLAPERPTSDTIIFWTTVYFVKRIYLESEDWIQMPALSFIICGTLHNSWIFLTFSSSGGKELAYTGWWEPIVNTSSQSRVHWCYISSLKLGVMGVFISQKLSNIINQGSSHPKEPVIKHLPVHHWF